MVGELKNYALRITLVHVIGFGKQIKLSQIVFRALTSVISWKWLVISCAGTIVLLLSFHSKTPTTVTPLLRSHFATFASARS